MEESYIKATKEQYAEARSRLDQASTQVNELTHKIRSLQQLVDAYETILRQAEQANSLQQPTPMVLDGDAMVDVEKETPETEKGNGQTGQVAPVRRPEFQHGTLLKAVDTLVGRPEFDAILTCDDYARAVYVITNQRELAFAKRTLNAELSRAVQRGVIERVGRGHYMPVQHQPKGIHEGREEAMTDN